MDLQHAILKGDFSMARRLIESGVDVNKRDGEGRTPLMLCCLHNGVSWALGVARMLLFHGGRVGLGDARGRSALTYAVLYERSDLVRLFLQALDFDLQRPDQDGRTALWHAARTSNRPIHDLLLQTMKRYGLSAEPSRTVTPLLAKGHATKQQGMVKEKPANKKSCDQKPQRDKSTTQPSPNNLPYKALPANLWTKRQSLYMTLGLKWTPASKASSEKEKGKAKEENPAPAPVWTWRLDMGSLTQALQAQISPSFRLHARPRPPASRPRRRLPRHGRGRKMSLGAIDDRLRRDNQAMMGQFRRRCSLAVIPMIRLAGGRRPTVPILEGLRLGQEGRAMPKPPEKIQIAKKTTP